ncbi:MAG: type II secretion system F family protein [Peptococcaceae bacterium]|nr:type II secretion system F family protein [Peptococcaceae bacterium]
MQEITIQTLVFASIILIFGALTSLRSARKEFIRKAFGVGEEVSPVKPRGPGFFERISIRFSQAGLNMAPHEVLILFLLVAAISVAAGFLLFGNFVIACFTAPFGIGVFWGYLKGRAKKRAEKQADEMEDWLLILSSHLRSGLSLTQALKISLERLQGALREEIEKVVRAVDLGTPGYEALEMVKDRIPAVEYKMVLVAVKVNTQLGGNLAAALENIARAVRERRRMRSEAKALSAQGRIASNAILFVVVGLIVILRVLSPDYLSPFFENILGMMVFTASLGLSVLGWWVIRKITIPKI